VVVRVECYAGHRSDERPLRFALHDCWLEIEEILDRWYGPDSAYFRVRAGDGCLYVLRHNEPEGPWTLEAFRQPTL
jgi:hypothetical protein